MVLSFLPILSYMCDLTNDYKIFVHKDFSLSFSSEHAKFVSISSLSETMLIVHIFC